MIKRYLYIGLGGGIGSLSRYILLDVSQRDWITFPYSTILINLIGAFSLTFLLNLTLFNKLTNDLKLAINVGVIGSFTTFSLIMIDMIRLINTPSTFILYYFITIFGGLLISYFGYQFAEYLNKRGDLT